MKLTKETLKRIIKEELRAVLQEGPNSPEFEKGYRQGGAKDVPTKADKQRAAAFKSSKEAQQAQADAINREKKASALQDAINSTYKDIKDLSFRNDYEKIKAIKEKNSKYAENKEYVDGVLGLLKQQEGERIQRDAEKTKKNAEKETVDELTAVVQWLKSTSKTSWKKAEGAESAKDFEDLMTSLENDKEKLLRFEGPLKNLIKDIGGGNLDLYRSIVKKGGRSVLQKTGSFLTGKGFKEE